MSTSITRFHAVEKSCGEFSEWTLMELPQNESDYGVYLWNNGSKSIRKSTYPNGEAVITGMIWVPGKSTPWFKVLIKDLDGTFWYAKGIPETIYSYAEAMVAHDDVASEALAAIESLKEICDDTMTAGVI